MMVITIITKMFVYNNRIYRQCGNSIIEFVDPTPEAEYSEFVYSRRICDLSHAWEVSHYVANNMLFVVYRTIQPEKRVCEIFDLSKEGECCIGMIGLPYTQYSFGENINVHGNLLIVDEPHNSAYDCLVYDIQTLKHVSSIPRTKNTQSPSMLFSNYMFVCTEDKNMHMQLHMYDLRTGKELKCVPLGSSGTTLFFPFKLLEFRGFIYFFCFRFIVRVNLITEEVVRKTFAPHHRVDLVKIKRIDDCHVYYDDVLYVMARDNSYIRDLYSGSLGDIFSSASDIVPAFNHRYSFEIHRGYALDVSYYRNLMVIDCGDFVLEVRLDIKSSKEKHLYSDVWFEYDSYYRVTSERDEHGFSKVIRFNVDIDPGTWSTNDIWNTFDMTKGLSLDPNYDALKRSCYKRNNFSRLERFASYVRCPRAYVQLMSDEMMLRKKKRVDVNLMVLKALIRADSPDDVCQDIFSFDLQRREKIGTNDLLLRIIASFLN